MTTLERIDQCCAAIRQKTDVKPLLGIVLGSGLGSFADSVQAACALPYSEIDGFPVSTAPSHRGRFVFGSVGGVPVVVMQGRVHFYEGYSPQEVVLPIRVMGRLGIKTLVLTNVSGGVNLSYSVGDFMLIRDHISFFAPSPLVGPNMDELGPRFADMTQVYDKGLLQMAAAAGNALGLPMQSGVYLQTTGPQFETPAEIAMARGLGADAVGMSTVCEAIAARHMGLQVLGISCIANMAAGITGQQLSGEDVNEAADLFSAGFGQLLNACVQKLGE